MCGISISVNGTIGQTVLMGEAIKHRGTRHNLTEIDNIKVWFSCLPITDATAPMQPFIHNKKYFWLNGFISNYKELAEKYKIELATNCDTELLSKFPGKWDELNGFFSIVVYNSVTKKLDYFTDRYGCKQLYKYQTGETTFICSEVKGIASVVDLKLDPYAVDDWLYSLGTMTNDTVFKFIKRVDALPFIQPKSISIPYPEAKKRLSELLDQSIKRNKVEGIKDGVFLSGGVDSGYLANRLKPDYCFSMDYVDKNYSEAANIKLNSVGTHLSMICNEYLFNKYKEKTFLALDDLKAGSSYTNFALTEFSR